MLVFMDGIKPVHAFLVGGEHYTVYTGLLALNVTVTVVAQLLHNVLMMQPEGAR